MCRVPTIGMALIVRDERSRIARCLESFWPCVDRVVVLDTGSTDATLEAVERFAAARPEGTELRTGTFAWRDDFAAARTAADDLLGDVDWQAWVDADDVIVGAESLRGLAACAPDGLAAYLAAYCHTDGRVFPRERLVRRRAGRWVGRVHERKLIDGAGTLDGQVAQLAAGRLAMVSPAVLRWQHERRDWTASGERNRRILARWATEDPQDADVRWLLAASAAGPG